jgi:signal transduction histidine kinase
MNGPSSLISRFAASTAVFAAAIVLLAVVAFHAIRGDIFRDSFESPLDQWSVFLAGHIGRDPETARAAASNHHMGVVLGTGDQVYAFDPQGRPVTKEYLDENFANARHIIVQGHGDSHYGFYLQNEEAGAWGDSVLYLWVAGLLFLVGVVYFVQLSQLRPLRWLKEGVDKVSEGELSTRVPVVRMDEIGQVGRAFNHMTERVEQMLNDHDRLMADVSHELRSPLARIKVALELLPEGDKREQIAADVRTMEALTTMLLERERIKHRSSRPEHTRFDLVQALRTVVAGFDESIPAVTIAAVPETLPITADESLVRVLLKNLIDNAVKFSVDDSAEVEVRAQATDDKVVIKIDDDGAGIPEDMTGRVMEPFVKLDPSRGHRSGYGLGLNLCLRIAQAHKGDIRIERREPRGTRVTVELDVCRPQ